MLKSSSILMTRQSLCSDESLRSLFSLFERYERASGAKLNISKSHGLLFGTWKYRADLPVQLDWSSEAITVLGCRIANEESVDWDSLITKFESQLTLWQQRQLSFRGRALVANVLGLSLFWYQATVFDMLPRLLFSMLIKSCFLLCGVKRESGWLALPSSSRYIRAGSVLLTFPRRFCPFVQYGSGASFQIHIIPGLLSPHCTLLPPLLISLLLRFYPIHLSLLT